MRSRHKDLEFHIDSRQGKTLIFKTFAEAAACAVGNAASHGQPVTIDVVAWSRGAARVWGGDHAVEEYDADPEASVHERIIIKAESRGRIA
jgi:hypothetical protein